MRKMLGHAVKALSPSRIYDWTTLEGLIDGRPLWEARHRISRAQEFGKGGLTIPCSGSSIMYVSRTAKCDCRTR